MSSVHYFIRGRGVGKKADNAIKSERKIYTHTHIEAKGVGKTHNLLLRYVTVHTKKTEREKGRGGAEIK